MGTTHNREDEVEAAGAKEDEEGTTQRMDVHRPKEIPQDMEGEIPGEDGPRIPSTR